MFVIVLQLKGLRSYICWDTILCGSRNLGQQAIQQQEVRYHVCSAGSYILYGMRSNGKTKENLMTLDQCPRGEIGSLQQEVLIE